MEHPADCTRIDDLRGVAADIFNLGLWGNGDAQVALDDEHYITDAMELSRDACAGKRTKGAAVDQGDTPVS